MADQADALPFPAQEAPMVQEAAQARPAAAAQARPPAQGIAHAQARPPAAVQIEDEEANPVHRAAVDVNALKAAINGPWQLGISAGNDIPDNDGIIVPSLDEAGVRAVLLFDAEDEEIDPAITRAMIGALFFLASAPGVAANDRQFSLVKNHAGAVAAGIEDIQIGITLGVMTKVTWWQTNHHVGQKIGDFQGSIGKYVGSLAAKLNVTLKTETYRKAIWRLGHMFSTKTVLGIWGIIRTDKRVEDWISKALSPGRDIALRLNSSPAGVAKITDCCVAIRAMSRSAISKMYPFSEEMSELIRASEEITHEPAAYHVGAQYLIGKPAVILKEPSQELVELLGSFLLVTQPKGSLIAARVFSDAKGARKVNTEHVTNMKAILGAAVTQFDMEEFARAQKVTPGDWPEI